jgi:DMSO/TMAO reductase YedYZ molybdopterin-dependent catalytic subunit
LSFFKNWFRDLARISFVVAATFVLPCRIDAQAVALTVDGEVDKKLVLSLDELQSMPRQRIEIEQQGGRATYEGVALIEILRRAGIVIGRAPLQGKAMVSVLVATSVDGFQAVFALAELDSAAADRRILLVDSLDGRPLSDRDGPLRLIAPGDKYPLRWVRHVVRLTVGPVAAPRPER